jgi:hypothetical protein
MLFQDGCFRSTFKKQKRGRAALVGVDYAQRAGGWQNAATDHVAMGARASHAERPYRRERHLVANRNFQHRSTYVVG